MVRGEQLRRVVLVGWIGLAAGVLAQAPQRGPLASTRVVRGPAVAIDLPAADESALGAATNLLIASGVRFGLEGPAIDHTVPQVDFATPPKTAVYLTGLTLGDALDTIARANLRFRWEETGGAILARMIPASASPLASRLTRYAVANASPQEALVALIREAAPARDVTDPFAARGGVMGGRGAAPGPQPIAPLTVTLERPTVLEVLLSLGRASGALSWVIRYDRAPGSLDRASVMLLESGVPVAIASVAAGPPGPPSLANFRFPPTGDMALALTTYARLSGVAISFETLPPSVAPVRLRLVAPVLDLTGLAPSVAIARIVAHDSRYEWVERAGRFLVRPRASGSRSPLDAMLQTFVRTGEPFDATIGDLLQRIGVDVRLTSITGAPDVTAAAAWQRPIDVSFREPAVARDVLEGICRAFGPVTWVMRQQGSYGGRERV